MVVNCEEVWREISNYLEGEMEPDLRIAMDEHIRGCQRCAAVLDGTRNVVQLYGDERMLEVPLGFSQRLQNRLERDMPGAGEDFSDGWSRPQRQFWWREFEVGRSSISSRPDLRSQLAHPGTGVPPEMVVVISTDGKLSHSAVPIYS